MRTVVDNVEDGLWKRLRVTLACGIAARFPRYPNYASDLVLWSHVQYTVEFKFVDYDDLSRCFHA